MGDLFSSSPSSHLSPEQRLKSFLVRVLRFFLRRTSAQKIVHAEIHTILIIRQHDQLGDMLLAIPLLQAVRRNFPKAHITLVASPVNYEVMRHHPATDEVVNYDKKSFRRSPLEFVRFFRTLRSRPYDLAIVPATVSISMTSDLMAVFSRARVTIGPGTLHDMENPLASCYSHPVHLTWDATPRRHQSLRNIDILQPLGITDDRLTTHLGLLPDEQKAAREYLKVLRKEHTLLFGMHPGAGKPGNRWPAERFASLINRLCREEDAAVIVTAGDMDSEPLERVLACLDAPHLVLNKAPLRQVAAVINELDLFFTNDTGIMHIAGATKTNVLSLFGPTDPLQWAPTGVKNRYIASRDASTASITEEEVYAMAKIILAEIRSISPNTMR